MRNTFVIFQKELKSFFNSPMAYIFLVIFALVTGYFFTNTFFLYNQSDMRALFSIVPLVYLFFIPAVTMGLIAKEKSVGTIETISTLPIQDRDVVLGKFLAGYSLIIIGLMVTVIHYITLSFVGTNVDHGAVLSGYFGLILLGGVYSSVGVFSSSLTENSVVAFVQYLSVDFHLSNISRGVIDTRNLVYFGSVIGFFLFLTTRVVESRKWG